MGMKSHINTWQSLLCTDQRGKGGLRASLSPCKKARDITTLEPESKIFPPSFAPQLQMQKTGLIARKKNKSPASMQNKKKTHLTSLAYLADATAGFAADV